MERQRPELSAAHHRLVERELQRVLNALPEGCVDRDDGRSAGYEGLIEAMGRYDPRFGVSFERYARPRVRGAIIDGLRALTPFGRRGYAQLKALFRAHAARASHPPSGSGLEGLSPALEASFAQLQALATSLCLEALELSSSRQDGADHMAEEADLIEERARLSAAFERLSEADQTLIVAVYDLRQVGDGARQFAERLGVSPAAVSQRHKRAMRRLRALIFERDGQP